MSKCMGLKDWASYVANREIAQLQKDDSRELLVLKPHLQHLFNFTSSELNTITGIFP